MARCRRVTMREAVQDAERRAGRVLTQQERRAVLAMERRRPTLICQRRRGLFGLLAAMFGGSR